MNRHLIRRVISAVVVPVFVVSTGLTVTAAPTYAPSNVLQRSWSTLAATSPTLKNATVSAYAYDLTRGQVLSDVNADSIQTPASITKLVTSAAALKDLGTNFRYHTVVRIPKPSGGIKPQSIYLIGGGDPTLEANGSKDLEVLARLVAAKVRTAVNVVGVRSLYDASPYEPGWPIGDLPHSYGSGSSALMAEQAQIQVVVTGTTPGRPPTVRLEFTDSARAPEYFRIVNHGITAKPGQTNNLVVTRELGTNKIVVSGAIAPSDTNSSFLSVENSALFAATLFQDLLKQYGVKFTSGPETGPAPSPAGTVQIADHASDTLANLLKTQNQYSVNTMAENLYRMVGLKRFGFGTSDNARAAIIEFLQSAGVSTDEVQLYDGSGLSPLNAMSAKQMVRLLTYASRQTWFPAFEHSLMRLDDPVNAGVLRYHPFSLPKGTEVWLKTGNLSNQWNYAGYSKAVNGDLIAFAILDDGPPTDLNAHGGPLDEMVIDTARFPNVPLTGQEITDTGNQSGQMPSVATSLLQSVKADVRADQILGASVVSLDSGRTIWSVSEDKLLHAGLLPRLALAVAALKNKPLASGTVTVKADGPMSHGVLNGSLVIDGVGNPTLTANDLKQLASAVYDSGLRQITAPVEYVDLASGMKWSDATSWDSAGQWWSPPLSSLSVNSDLIQFIVSASASGQPVVSMSPSDAPVQFVNHISIAPGATTSKVNASLIWNTHTYVLNGVVPPNQTITIPVAPPNAAEVAAVAFRDALQGTGISVPTEVRPSTAAGPTATIVASLHGTTVRDLATTMLTDPSNLSASQVYTLLGTQAVTQIKSCLKPTDQVQDATGSGLENYMTPASVMSQLRLVWKLPEGSPLKHDLSARPWVVDTPRLRTVIGYRRGADGSTYAVVVFESAPWQGKIAPSSDP